MRYLESKIQQNIVSAVRQLYPKSLIFAVPNGGARRKFEAAIMKGEGVLPGVSDLIFLHKGKAYFIEVKSEDGKQRPSQKEFETLIKNQGFDYWIVRSATETIEKISKI